MKNIVLVLILSVLSLVTFASPAKINVDSYHQTNMEFIFLIKNKNYDKIILDCQGFINGLNLYSTRGHDIFTLPGYGHCMAIHHKIIKNVKNDKDSCLILDDKKGLVSVIDQRCE